MSDEQQNGQNGKWRLDRLEEWMNYLAEEHEKFNAEHKLLLTSQVLLTDSQRKTDLMIRGIGEKVDALIRIVDGIIRKDAP